MANQESCGCSKRLLARPQRREGPRRTCPVRRGAERV